MRFTLDLLGHRLDVRLDHPGEGGQPERDGQADALVERTDPYTPPIGFYPHARPEEHS